MRTRRVSATGLAALVALTLTTAAAGAARTLDPPTAALADGAAGSPLVVSLDDGGSGSLPLQNDQPPTPLHAQVGGAMNVALVHEGTLWLAVGPRLVALDVDDATAPVALGRTPLLPAVVEDAVAEPGRPMAWLAAGEWLLGVELGDPAAPTEVGRLALDGRARRVAWAGGQVWVLMADGRLLGVDVRGPRGPTVVAAIEAVDGRVVRDVAGRGDRLARLAVDPRGEQAPAVQQFDISVMGAPAVLSNTRLPVTRSGPGRRDPAQLEWPAERLWAFLEIDGVPTLVALEPQVDALVEVGASRLDRYAVAVAIAHRRAYVSGGYGYWNRVRAYDISDPTDVRALSEREWASGPFPGEMSRAMAVTDGHVWAASAGGYLTALDHRQLPSLPSVGAYKTAGEVTTLAFDAGHLYTWSTSAVRVIDARDPARPHHASLLVLEENYNDVAVSDGRAALAIWGEYDALFPEVELYDVRQPARPERLLEYRPVGQGGLVRLVALSDQWLALATTSGVGLLDISDPSAPKPEQEVSVDGRPHAMGLADDRLLTVTQRGRSIDLHRTDVLAAGEPSQSVALVEAVAEQPDVYLAHTDRRAFVLVHDAGPGPSGAPPRPPTLSLFVVDLSDPARLVLQAAATLDCTPDCQPTDMEYADGHLLVASAAKPRGVMAIDVRDPAAPHIARTFTTRTAASAVELDGQWLYVATDAGGLNVIGRPSDGWSGGALPPTPAPTATASPSPTAEPQSQEIFLPLLLL